MSAFTLPALLSIVVAFTASQQCGRSKIFPSVGFHEGEDAIPHSWPWHVSIQKETDGEYVHICSGVLISSKHVLTYRNCFKGWSEYQHRHKVLWGSVTSRNNDKEGTMLDIKDIVWPKGFKNGLVILELDVPPSANRRFVDRVCLTSHEFPKNAICAVTAFINDGDVFATSLQQTFVRVKSYEEIDPFETGDPFRAISVATEASQPTDEPFDLGSPLVCYDIAERRFVLQGVYSIKLDGKNYFLPSTTSEAYKWITETIGTNKYYGI